MRVCRAGLAQHPDYLSARVTLGRALLELQQFDEAQTELERVLQAAPDNLAAIRALAEIHQRRGESDDALKQFSTAHAAGRDDGAASRAAARLHAGGRSARLRCTLDRPVPSIVAPDDPAARRAGIVARGDPRATARVGA